MSVHHTAYICIAGLHHSDRDICYRTSISLTYGFTARDLFSAVGNPHYITGLSSYFQSYKAIDAVDRFIAADGAPALLEYHKDQFCISISIVSADEAYAALEKIIKDNSPKQYFEYCQYSDKILLQPSHCAVAIHLERVCGKWVCDPDISVDMDIKVAVFKAICTSLTLQWATGETLAKELNKIIPL